MDAKERMEWLVNFLIVRFGFVHRILSLTNKVPVPGLGTMGVLVEGSRFTLQYDPEFILKEKDEHLTFILFHEAMHIALHHCTSRRKCSNIATDLAVNELIPETEHRCERPPYGCFVERMKKGYPELEARQTAEWYDAFFRKAGEPGEGDDGHQSGQSGSGDDQGRSQGRLDSHDGWDENEMADEVIRAKIREIDVCDLWGNVSEGFKERVRAAQTRRINWRNHIRRFGGNLIWKHKILTLKRPNRRTGLLNPGYKRGYTERMLVCLDDSMSTHGLIPSFLGVINGMIESMPIDIVQFDAGITDGPRPYRRMKNFTAIGGGGTNFQPVIDLINKRGYRGAIILTDGVASACSKPKQAHVMWVLPQGKKPPVEWGKRIHLDPYV